ncbi:MAG: murein biosynthesis integral membrane protein MurJ [Streptosporangiales bacterium]|nr:murein biosynthesis integral membrane protein MurJ [Streptosporangiales bacterium]
MTVQDPPQDDTQAAPADTTDSLVRSSAVMAAGTLVSRITGFLRVMVIAAVLGSSPLSNAYNTANNAPFSLYELLLGGVLSAVLVPLLVRENKRDRREGDLYAQRLLTLVVLVLVGLTVLSVLGAPLILDLIANRMAGSQREIAVAFLRYFLPQVLFLGIVAVVVAILQSRRRFAAPMWAPVLNNLTVIATGLLFMYVVDGQPTPDTITAGETMLLGLGTSAGIVVQTLALLPSLLRAGFRPRPRLGFHRLGLGAIGRLGTWTIVYVTTNLAGLFVVTNIGGAVDRALAATHQSLNYGYTPYQNAFTVFSLPHAIVAVSVITALLPRMSSHAADGRFGLVRSDLSTGIRLAAVLIVPAAVALVALGRPVGVTIFSLGFYSADNAGYTGLVIAAFAFGLIPFSIFQLMLRVFYALQDTRTPALVNMLGTAVTIALGIGCYLVLPHQGVMISLALAYGVGYLVNTLVAAAILRRRLGGIDGRRVVGVLARMVAAAVPGGVLAWLATLGLTQLLGDGKTTAVICVVVGGLLVLGSFLALARALRVTEVATLVSTFRGRRASGG